MCCLKISFSRSLCRGPILYPTKNEEIYDNTPYQNFSMSFYITIEKKTSVYGSQVGHMWVTSGLLYGSVGQVGQQVLPTFNHVITDTIMMIFLIWSAVMQ